MMLNDLLPDLKLHLFRALDSKELCRLRSVSKGFYLDSALFRPLFDELFKMVLQLDSNGNVLAEPVSADSTTLNLAEYPVDYFFSYASLRSCVPFTRRRPLDTVKIWPSLILHARPLSYVQTISSLSATDDLDPGEAISWRLLLFNAQGHRLESVLVADSDENVDICFLVYSLNRAVVDHTALGGARRNVLVDLHYFHGGGWRSWKDELVIPFVTVLCDLTMLTSQVFPSVTSEYHCGAISEVLCPRSKSFSSYSPMNRMDPDFSVPFSYSQYPIPPKYSSGTRPLAKKKDPGSAVKELYLSGKDD